MFDINKIKDEWKVYCLNDKQELVDIELMINYELNHNGVYIPLIEIFEGNCSGCEKLDYFIVDNDFYNYTTDYVMKIGSETFSLPVGDGSELIFF